LPPEIDFSGFLRKWKAVEENWKAVEEIGKPFQKAESRRRNRKAIEEIGKPLKKIFLDFSEMRKPLKKIELLARKIGFYERILERLSSDVL
jgi:hypothetical protein